MGEKESKKPNNQIQIKIKLKTLIILITIIILFLSANVFAGVMGQGNIFFLVKNLVTTGTISGKDELLSDREITISYDYIDISEGIYLQVNKIVIEPGKSTLYLHEKNEKGNKLKYELYDNSKNMIANLDTKYSNYVTSDYELQITANKEVEKDGILALKVYDNENILRVLNIDLGKREITVEGEDDINKISEVELKKYLGHFALLKYDLEFKNDMVIKISENMAFDLFEIYEVKRNDVNDIAKSFYEKNLVMDESVKNGKEVLKTDSLYKYSDEYDEYRSLTDQVDLPVGRCINIDNIEYSNGVYSIDFIYGLIQYPDTDYEEANYYNANIKLELNKNSKYSKYTIVSFGEPNKIKDTSKIKETIEKEIKETLSTCEHVYECVPWDYTKEVHTTLDGTHECICIKCGDKKTEKHNFDKWCDITEASLTNTWTLWCNDCRGYVYETDYNVVKNSGYGIYEKESSGCKHEYECVPWDYTKEVHTTLDGTHECICKKCGDKKTEKHNFDKWCDITEASLTNTWTLWCNDCGGYVYETDYNVVKNSGYEIKSNKEMDKVEIKQEGDFYNIRFSIDGYNQTGEIKCSKSLMENGGTTFSSWLEKKENGKKYLFMGGAECINGRMNFRVSATPWDDDSNTSEFLKYYYINYTGDGSYELNLGE